VRTLNFSKNSPLDLRLSQEWRFLAGFLEGVRRFSYFRSLPLAFHPMPSKFEASWRKPYGTYSDLRGNYRTARAVTL